MTDTLIGGGAQTVVTGAADATGGSILTNPRQYPTYGQSICLVYRPGGTVDGPDIFNSWPDLMNRLASLRSDAGGTVGLYTIAIDDDLVSPAVVPASPVGSPWDLTEVDLVGARDVNSFTTNLLDLANGAHFVGLRSFRNVIVTNRNTGTPADNSCVDGSFIILSDGAQIATVTGGAAFYGSGALAPGGTITTLLKGISNLGGTGLLGPVFNIVGGFLFVGIDGSSGLLKEVVVGDAASFLLFGTASMKQVPTTLPNWAGTILPPRIDVPGTFLPNPYLGAPSAVAVTAAPSQWLRLTSAAGNIAQNLPKISAAFNALRAPGCQLVVTNYGGANVVNLSPQAGDTVNGAGGPLAVAAGVTVILMSDGVSDWRQIK